MKRPWGFFKWCKQCNSKLPPSDGHSLYLICLGESHRVKTSLHCVHFSKQARKHHAVRLQVALTQAALTVLMASSSDVMQGTLELAQPRTPTAWSSSDLHHSEEAFGLSSCFAITEEEKGQNQGL